MCFFNSKKNIARFFKPKAKYRLPLHLGAVRAECRHYGLNIRFINPIFSNTIVLRIKICYKCKMCILWRSIDPPFLDTFFLSFFRFSYYYFKRVLIHTAKSACPTALNRGIFFAKNVLFFKISTLAHYSFIYYISKMFYCMPNAHRVFM